jgi:NAD-dependent dihydropyrimidine dehydrogenase PreA subunit
MTYVIAGPCIDVKDTACVQVCPVDCIHPRPSDDTFDAAVQLYINPVECIDCAACEPVCPVSAIFADADLPADQTSFREKNSDYFQLSSEDFAAKYARPPG